jgi:hypothetical protein
MTIRQQGGIFGRNPTFNDVDVEGTLTVGGLPVVGGTGTMAAQDANAVAITGGNIDGTIIGATTKANVTGASGVFDDLNIKVLAGDTTINGTCYSDTGGNEISIDLRKSNQDTEGNTATATGDRLGSIIWRGNSGSGFTPASRIRSAQLGSASTQTPAEIKFETSDGTSFSEKMNISPAGDVKVNLGNLVIGTSGKGIDFSATSGTGTSELFDDYEEGTWTPTQGSFTTWTSPTFAATYTKVGRLVTLNIAQTGGVIAASSAALYIGGSPYSAANDAVGVVSDGSINDHGHCVAGGTNIFFSNIIAPEINFIVTITFHVA